MKLFPEHWQLCPANTVCAEIVDCLNKTAPVVEHDTGYRMIRTTNVRHGRVDVDETRFVEESVFNKWTRRSRPKRGDIILSREAPLGEVGLLRSDAKVFLGQRTMLYRADPAKLDQQFLYYQMIGPYVQAQIHGQGSGSTVAHLRVPDAETLVIPIAPIKTQRKIGAILSAYDELIENNQRRIALLEKMAEEIYREWFVRLRFPGHEKVKKVKGVPEGWRDQKFGQFCQLQRGYDLTDADVQSGPYPVIASTSIKTYHNQYKVEPPVITTGRSGSLGEVLFVNTRAWPHNTALYVKNFFGNSAFLVYYTLKNMRLENFNAGAGVPTLNRNHLNGIPIIVPSKELQDRFDEVVSKFLTQAGLLRNTNQKLVETRDLLLPRIISGKLSVDHLDIQFPSGMEDRP